MSLELKWYVIHTYSGYENKVKATIEKTIENLNMQEQIQEIYVPVSESVEVKDGKKKIVQNKIYPGYVLLKMDMNDETWYVVRNTRGVTSFVGPGSKPVALSEEEVLSMGVNIPRPKLDMDLYESVRIKSGPFEGSCGIVTEINDNKSTLVVTISMFSRETPVTLDFSQVEKV